MAGLIERRVAAATSLDGPDESFMRYVQGPVWDRLCDRYFRLEIDGWDRIPNEPSLLIGVHSGGALTMDAWTLGRRNWPPGVSLPCETFRTTRP